MVLILFLYIFIKHSRWIDIWGDGIPLVLREMVIDLVLSGEYRNLPEASRVARVSQERLWRQVLDGILSAQ